MEPIGDYQQTLEFCNTLDRELKAQTTPADRVRVSRYKLITVTGIRYLIKYVSKDKHNKDIVMPIVKCMQEYDPTILMEDDEPALVAELDVFSGAYSRLNNLFDNMKKMHEEQFLIAKELNNARNEFIKSKKIIKLSYNIFLKKML